MQDVGAIPPRKRRRRRKSRFGRRWSSRKIAQIGFLTGLGRSSAEIERELADGTQSASIRRQWRRWRLKPLREKGAVPQVFVPIELTVHARAKLTDLAAARGVDPEYWASRILAAAIRDDLFEAVVDDERAS